MLLLFTCGMKAHIPVMHTGSEKSWNGGREGKIMITLGDLEFIKTFVHNVCIYFSLSRRKSLVVKDLNIDNYFMFWLS